VRPRRKQEISIDLLDRLSRTELRALWIQEFGEAPPATLGRDVLALGVASASKFWPPIGVQSCTPNKSARAALPKRMVYADFAAAPALISDCEVSDRRLAAALVSGW
jgi:hypothetical protein